MEKALRLYNGKALINSVNGKRSVMAQIFPLVKKYGGVVLALCLDEDGIPMTAEGRLAIAEKIYKTAESYGIEKKDILIDALAMTISSEPEAAKAALGTLDGIRERYNGHTILGVSNISFGLPQREIINSAFYTMALSHGLSAAIINPNSELMMRAYYAYRALAGLDANCQEFIEKAPAMAAVAAAPAPVSGSPAADSSGSADSLQACIERGLKDGAAAFAAGLLKDHSALEIINGELIPGLNKVGKDFENGKAFLPQLLMSAEAAKTAFEVLKSHMAGSGEVREKKGTIVLATVKGDIHDIGKNIVKVLLENYDYKVIDLGKDVDPSVITETVVRTHAKYCGLSALMTTTVPAMEATIRQLRDAAPWCKVMVGGAVMTQAYADMIGADAYCKDAMAGVNYAEENA
jgi:5-methyltetrahydrofolate--homocysteine methyltransferase